jgi:signal transduction histidine kinase
MRLPKLDCFDLVSDAVLAHQNGRWLYANPAAATLLGADSAAALVGQPIPEGLKGTETPFTLEDGTEAVLIVVNSHQKLRQLVHEFNNVLMAISPWGETLKRRYPNEDMVQKAAGAIGQAIQKGRRITDEIRDLVKGVDRSPKQ